MAAIAIIDWIFYIDKWKYGDYNRKQKKEILFPYEGENYP